MAENKLPISIVISAVDNVTYKVMSINEKLKKITAPVGKVQAAFKALGDEAGLGNIMKGLGKIGSTGKEFFSELGSALFKVATVGIAAATAIFGITKSFADAGDEVAMMSKRLGLSTDAYQELRYAASRADVDQELFNSSMDRFNKGIGQAAAGTGDAFVGFNALGISVRGADGKLRKMEELLPLVADRLGGIKNESVRAAVASKLFGKEGAKLNGIFLEGAEGLNKLRAEARRVGAVMTPEQIKAAEEFDDGMKSVGATLLMVRNIIGAALAPKILELGKNLQTYILDNKDKISEFAAAFADRLPGNIQSVVSLLSTFGAIIGKIVGFVQWFSDTFGSTATVVAGFLLYFNGLTIAAAKFALSIGSFLPMLIRLGLVFAGLITWPVALGAALVAAAIAIWKYWGPITEKLGAFWDKISGVFSRTGAPTETGGGTLPTQGASLGPAAGFGGTLDAAAKSSSSKSENHVLVDFSNLPTGTRVESKKADKGLDLSMGYAMESP